MTVQTLFVTSHGPGAGKTLVAAAILRRLRALQVRAVGVKPIETESRRGEDHDLYSIDGLLLAAESTPQVPLPVIAPYLFATGGAGASAMSAVGLDVTLADLVEAVRGAERYGDLLVVEGATGAFDQVAADGIELDFARALGAQLVVVVQDQAQLREVLDGAAARALPVALVVTRSAPDDLQAGLQWYLPRFDGDHAARVTLAEEQLADAAIVERLLAQFPPDPNSR